VNVVTKKLTDLLVVYHVFWANLIWYYYVISRDLYKHYKLEKFHSKFQDKFQGKKYSKRWRKRQICVGRSCAPHACSYTPQVCKTVLKMHCLKHHARGAWISM